MFFTQDDYRKIEEYLQKRAVKDTEFPEASPLSGREKVTIIQDCANKITDVDTIFKFNTSLPLVNITDYTGKSYSNVMEAVADVPEIDRKRGVFVTYNTNNNGWSLFQFTAVASDDWNNVDNWTYCLGFGDSALFSSIGDGLEIKDMMLDVKVLDSSTLDDILNN